MKSIKYLLTAFLLTASTTLFAQKGYDPSHWRIDWQPDRGELYDALVSGKIRRYTLAAHPYHLMKGGMKVDFEMELRDPGKWLQVGLMGYYVPENRWRDEPGELCHRWGNLASGYEEFTEMVGVGAGIAYKSMFSHRGFYFNTGLLYNYYNVKNPESRYVAIPQGGLTYYERTRVMGSTGYHQPTIFFNVGKHVALSRSLFIDAFTGIGYMYSIYNGGKTKYDEFVSFGYRGSYLNLGLRLGVLWHDRK
jgi:hypothetical protein